MKKIIFVSVCLAVFCYSNTAFCRAGGFDLEQWRIPDIEARLAAERAQAAAERAEARAAARAERAAREAAYKKALDEAYQAAESSRGNAEKSAEDAQSKERKLAQLRKSMIDPAKVDAANRRVQEALRDQARQTERLASLQRRLASITVNQVSFGTAVLMNEEDFYKKISPAQFVTPWMKQQAEKNYNAQLRELDELKEQSRFLSTFSQKSEERIRVERQIQLKAIFGLGSDLLDLLPAPSFKNADKKLKVAYEATKLAVALMYTATAPDYVERTKKASESVNNLISLYKEAALNPTLANDPKLNAAVQGLALSLKIASFMIDQDSKDNKNPVTLPEEICYDYIKLALSFTGKLSPHVKLARALISVKERTDQYIYAEDAIKQLLRMKEQGFNAEEYINDSSLQVKRDLEASKRIIRAYKLGDRK